MGYLQGFRVVDDTMDEMKSKRYAIMQSLRATTPKHWVNFEGLKGGNKKQTWDINHPLEDQPLSRRHRIAQCSNRFNSLHHSTPVRQL
jgi:hypothetical protein